MGSGLVDPRLRHMIEEYLARVARAVMLLEASGIPRPISNGAWPRQAMPESERLADGSTFFKHGFGIRIDSARGMIDFNFGWHGETDGFVEGFLWDCLEGTEHQMFTSRRDFQAELERAIASGAISYDGCLYFLSASD